MAADLWLYWGARGHITEGRRRLGALLEALDSDTAVQPRTLWVAGYLAVAQTDPEQAVGLLHKALDTAAAIRDEASIAFATQYLAQCRLFSGDLESAAQLFDRAHRMHRSHGEPAAAFALTDLAVTVMLAGDLHRAVRLYDEALEMTDAGGDPWTRSHAFWGLGVATFLLGDLDRAEQAEKEALDLIGVLDERSGIALCLDAMAWIAAAREDFERAARLQGASASVWESIPGQLPEPVQAQARKCAQQSVHALGASRRNRMFEDGRRLERPQAVAFGLGTRTAPSAVAEQPTSVLTKREGEVAALVAEGLTDRQIARRLVISQRTAESHVQHILSKLGFRSRARIATWVAKHQTDDQTPN